MKVDNSSLTGESEPQNRKVECTNENPLETANIAFYSTSVLDGKMKGIVINTGDNTVIGRIASLVSKTARQIPPIEKEIKFLINVLSILAIGLGLTFMAIGFILKDPWQQNIVLFIGI